MLCRCVLPLAVAVMIALAGLMVLSRGAPPAAAQQTERVELFRGCNNVSLTWPNGTPTSTVAAAVTPASALLAIWRFSNQAQTFQGFSPQFPQQSDLTTVNRIDAVFICMTGPGALVRPVLTPGSAGTTMPTATATATATATTTAGQTRITFINSQAPRGSAVTIAVQTTPNTLCTATATVPGGQTLTISGATASPAGAAVLYWLVPTTVTPGSAVIRVTCGATSDQAVITIV